MDVGSCCRLNWMRKIEDEEKERKRVGNGAKGGGGRENMRKREDNRNVERPIHAYFQLRTCGRTENLSLTTMSLPSKFITVSFDRMAIWMLMIC